jgi:hypothetical protein
VILAEFSQAENVRKIIEGRLKPPLLVFVRKCRRNYWILLVTAMPAVPVPAVKGEPVTAVRVPLDPMV